MHTTIDNQPCHGPFLDEGTGTTYRCPDCGAIIQTNPAETTGWPEPLGYGGPHEGVLA